MRRIVASLPILIVSCAILFAPQESEASAREAARANKKGVAAAEKKDWDEAIKQFREAVDERSTTAHRRNLSLALTQRGLNRLNKKRYDDAIEDLSEAIKLRRNNTPAYRYRAFAYLGKKRWNEALEDYSVAIKRAEKDREPLFRRAYVHTQLKNYDAAIKDYSAILKNNDEDVDVLLLRAYLYELQEKFEPALKDVNRVLELKPRNKAAQAQKKRLLLRSGKVKPPRPTPRMRPLKRKPFPTATPTRKSSP